MMRAGVIGHPVAHSLSPIIHGFWLAQQGLDGQYERIDVAPERLAAFCSNLAASGLRGVNVTLPHKVHVAQHCARLTPLAQQVGAVNILLPQPDGTLLGHNSDVGGFALPLSRRIDLAGRKATVIGAGGAARAIVTGLASLGVAEIHVVNRTVDSIAALESLAGSARLIAHGWLTVPRALTDTALLVNTTSLGMKGQPPLLIDLAGLAADAVVNDIVYTPLETSLLTAARARGLRTIDGLEMLVGQAAEAFALFYGAAPNRAEDDVLRSKLVAL